MEQRMNDPNVMSIDVSERVSGSILLRNKGPNVIEIRLWGSAPNAGLSPDVCLPVLVGHQLEYEWTDVRTVEIDLRNLSPQRFHLNVRFRYSSHPQSPTQRVSLRCSRAVNLEATVDAASVQGWKTRVVIDNGPGGQHQTIIEAGTTATVKHLGEVVTLNSNGGKGALPNRSILVITGA